MKKIIIIILALATNLVAYAQDGIRQSEDSLVFRQAAQIDSSLSGKSIFNMLSAHKYGEGSVSIHQSQAIVNAMKRQAASNSSRRITGYRVRIFFDNAKSARNASESVLNSFRAANPGVPAYRSYQNPFFRVVAGDFRTKSEAMEFLQKIKYAYPSALVVKEHINYPAADKEHNYVVDTISVVRPSINI